MKKILMILIVSSLLFAGCDSLRFAPTETQKQNAWLHNRTTAIAAETARVENASERLKSLTHLSELQSRPISAYIGGPKEFLPAETAEEILTQSNFTLAKTALQQSVQRPDLWQLADSGLELAIGIFALLGGVYGTKAVWFLRQARTKSEALREIVGGNELFKNKYEAYAGAFKEAHKYQSPQTRQIVTEIKSG